MKKSYTSIENKNFTEWFKILWLLLNTIFVLNYTLSGLNFFKMHILCFPNSFNCLCLILAYLITIIQNHKNGVGYVNNPNTLSLFFFITFPSKIFLLSYYFLSLYHIIGYYYKILIITKFKNSIIRFLRLLFKELYIFRNYIGELALYCNILGIIIAICTFKFSIAFSCCLIARQQYHNNKSMERIVLSIFHFCDSYAYKLPKYSQQLYSKLKQWTTNKKIKNE